MAIRTELSLRLPNSPGTLAAVCRALSEERINVLAMALGGGTLRLVVDNHVRAAGALAAHHHKVDQRDVLVVTLPNEPDSLRQILTLAAEAGVNVEYAYAGAAEGASMGTVVLGVDNPLRAATAAGL